jgi:LmbE family N-acetylglucosaminyl deacetylase
MKRILKGKKLKVFFVLAAIGAVIVAFLSYGVSRAPSVNIDSIDPMRQLSGTDRILIFAPHCDDEVLGTGGLIMKAVALSAQVRVVQITNGDNNIFSTDIQFKTLYPSAKRFIETGEERQQETIKAMTFLGVNENDILFLGYPDRGIRALYLTNWPNHNPYRSPATHETRSPYKLAYEKNALYSGENMLKNIKQIIRDFSPTIVIAPHMHDHHPDHRYSYEFITQAISEVYGSGDTARGPKPDVFTYLVHYHLFPRPSGLKPEEYLLPPFIASFDMDWYKMMLSDDERDKKYDAIRLYKSQLRTPELGRLMRSFVRKNELFEGVEQTEY